MKKLKQSLALLLAIASLMALVACGNNTSTNTTTNTTTTTDKDTTQTDNTGSETDDNAVVIPEGARVGAGVHGGTGYVTENVQRDVVQIAASAMPTTISPWAGTATGRHMVMYEMYQPLFEFDKATGDRVLVIAESIEQLDEYTFRIKIHDDVYDSEGNPFTADDAVYSITTCKTLGNVSGMNYIDSVTKVDDYTLDVKMTVDNDYQFDSSVTMIMMVTQKAYEESGDEMSSQPIGTGPYVMTKFESGSVATLEINPNYWGAYLNDRDNNPAWYYHAQNVNKIEFIKVAEASQQSIALETGSADVAYAMSGDEATRLMDNDAFNVWKTKDSKSFNLFFNCGDKSPMASKELRQAVCYAIDAAGVLQFTGNYGTLSTTFGAAVFADCNPDWANEDYYGYDLDKAKELIEASGFDTSTKIRLMVSTGSSEAVSIATVIQSYLMNAGLNVQIDQYDNATFASSKYNEDVYDIRLDSASYTCLADLWTQFLDSGTRDKSYAQIKDEELESLLYKLKNAEGRTVENVNAAHYYIKEQAYCYGLYCGSIFNTTTSDIVEFVYMPKLYAMPGAFTYT